MLDNLRADVSRLCEIKGRRSLAVVLGAAFLDNGFQAVLLHRLGHWLRRHGVPFLGPFLARLSIALTGVDISPAARIGPGLYISHGVGIVVGGSVQIGARAFLLQQVTIGAPSQSRLEEMPTLGEDVFVGAGARLIGPIRIGSEVFIGANALVTRDIPDRSKVVSTADITITPRPG